MTRAPLLLIATTLTLHACTRAASSSSGADAAASCAQRASEEPPVLTRMQPDSAAADVVRVGNTVVELLGCGFDAAGNTVRFGPEPVSNVPSTAGGTSMRFTVPASIRGGGEVAPMPMVEGVYDVVIETSRGRSHARPFKLY